MIDNFILWKMKIFSKIYIYGMELFEVLLSIDIGRSCSEGFGFESHSYLLSAVFTVCWQFFLDLNIVRNVDLLL